MIEYNKAVRDRIPEIIRESGKKCKVTGLSDAKFKVALEEKLQEELDEYMESKNLEELSDIVEIIHRLAELYGISYEQLEKIRLEKKQKRGGFKKNILLIKVD